METQLLKNPEIIPSDEVLKETMGVDLYSVYTELIGWCTNAKLEPIWRYYNDGKAWLCKIVLKKKTVCWLSVWDGYMKTSFFFTEKTKPGVLELDINDEIKQNFLNMKTIGKLIPMILDINKKEQLDDMFKIARYKMSI